MGISLKETQQIAQVLNGPCTQSNLCPVKDIMALFGDKWTMYAILLMGQNPRMRFNELRMAITGISQRMLTVTLRSLEENGIVTRTLYAEIPPRVEYSLTTLGESLLKQLLQLANWADANFNEIVNARKKYKKKQLNK